MLHFSHQLTFLLVLNFNLKGLCARTVLGQRIRTTRNIEFYIELIAITGYFVKS